MLYSGEVWVKISLDPIKDKKLADHVDRSVGEVGKANKSLDK